MPTPTPSISLTFPTLPLPTFYDVWPTLAWVVGAFSMILFVVVTLDVAGSLLRIVKRLMEPHDEGYGVGLGVPTEEEWARVRESELREHAFDDE